MALCNVHQAPMTRRIKSRRDPRYCSARTSTRFREHEFSQWMRSCPSYWVKQLSTRQRKFGHCDSMCGKATLAIATVFAVLPQLQPLPPGESELAMGHMEHPVEAVAHREVVDAAVQCNLDDMPEPISRISALQRSAEGKIMTEFWRDPQQSYSVDKHFICFEDVETVCIWAGQLPDEEVSKLAGRFFGREELCGQPPKKVHKALRNPAVSNRHVTEACMLAEALPIFRRTLLLSSREVLRNVSSEKAAVATCYFIVQLIQARVLPGALRAEMMPLIFIWPSCMRVILPAFNSSRECDQPLQRTRTVRARMPEGVPASPYADDLFRTQPKPTRTVCARSDDLPRTQSEPTRTSCACKEGLFRTQSDPGSKSYSTVKTSLRPHGPHVRFAKELVVRVEYFEDEVFEDDAKS